MRVITKEEVLVELDELFNQQPVIVAGMKSDFFKNPIDYDARITALLAPFKKAENAIQQDLNTFAGPYGFADPYGKTMKMIYKALWDHLEESFKEPLEELLGHKLEGYDKLQLIKRVIRTLQSPQSSEAMNKLVLISPFGGFCMDAAGVARIVQKYCDQEHTPSHASTVKESRASRKREKE